MNIKDSPYALIILNLPSMIFTQQQLGVQAQWLKQFQDRMIHDYQTAVKKAHALGSSASLTDDEKFACCVKAGLPWKLSERNNSIFPEIEGSVAVQVTEQGQITIYKQG